jgi:carbonic anhydrase/acetyltransferase-like protein (isoleucine patch superfamily)
VGRRVGWADGRLCHDTRGWRAEKTRAAVCPASGDVNSITIGAGSNLQDGCVVHVAKDNVGKVVLPTVVGERVTVGHGSTLHACTLQDESFVGMGATIMDGAVVRTSA